MSTTINAPTTAANGPAHFGPVQLLFKDGVAEYDGDLSDGLRAYLVGAGYGIDSTAPEPAEEPEPADPRDYTGEQVGSPLRDAAVDPAEGDFLPPTNAGEANPHGPLVVSPGVHAMESKAVVPGAVGDIERQQERETQLAAETLSGDTLVPDATEALADDTANVADAADIGDAKPAGNASEATWRTYATNHGVPVDEAAGMSRNELRDRFTD